ncbi:MAG: GNAT family N-acetyltransferase [Armatimonadetes bacterium]|nr:GNAT family N-acetyltransferase [Armatimonadota bacterium]
MVTYRRDAKLTLEQILDLYRSCSLGERRPIDQPERMAAMVRNANLVVTAWDGDLLVGIARSLTDFANVTYLADLAVRESHQRQGIGRELIRETRAAGGEGTSLVLLSAPAAVDYYPRLGFTAHPSAWWLRPGDPLT